MSSTTDPTNTPPPGGDGLQFQTAETVDEHERCVFCKAVLEGTYYQIQGLNACAKCGEARKAQQDLPDSREKFLKALLYGSGAAFAGWVVWATVQIITGINIGLLAIAVGWFVGTAIRKATEGHTSRKYQFMAVFLTYLAISMSFLPVLVAEGVRQRKAVKATGTNQTMDKAGVQPQETKIAPVTVERPALGRIFGLVILLGICFASPVISAFVSFPSGLISVFIVFLGLQRAWQMTKPDEALIMGPYAVESSE